MRITVGRGLALVVVVALSHVACSDNGSAGEFECTGAACVCPGTGDCRIDCLGGCDLQCAGSGLCDFLCGDGCLASCTGSGPCLVDVGDQSLVECTGSGGCDVACVADCTVRCPGSGECRVFCEPGFSCDIEECSGSVESCPDGTLVCGGACP